MRCHVNRPEMYKFRLANLQCPRRHDLTMTQGNYHTWPTNDNSALIFYKGVGVYLEEICATGKRNGGETESNITMKGGAVT
jgi:hypothetical protein